MNELAVLTRRERQVVECYAAGQRTSEIAESLGITVNTVRTHRDHLLRKLGISFPRVVALFVEEVSA